MCKNKRGLAIHQGKSGCQRVRSSGQRIASLASETKEYSSLDSNNSTEELSVQETAPDVLREPEEDEEPLLELLQTQSSFDTEQESGPIDLSKALPQDPGNQGSNGLRHPTRHYGNNWTRTSTIS